MAEEFEYFPDPTPAPDTNENPTWGDYGKSIGAGVLEGGLAPVAANVRAATEGDKSASGKFANDMARILQRHFNTAAADINESRTEVARKRASATVTSSDFWEHPISASMLKAAGMTGPLAAAVFSGGPVGAALVSGALSTGSYLNEIDKALDAATDAQLRENAYYDSLRSMGMDEQDARIGLKRKITGNQDILNFAVGSLAGALGPAGKLASGVSGRAAVGLASKDAGALARAGIGAAEGAVGEMVQEGVENATVQSSKIDASLQKGFDDQALVDAVLEGGLLGGVMGGVAGAAVGGKGKAKAKEIQAKRAQPPELPPELPVTSEVKPEDVNQQVKGTGTGNQIPPVETAPTGDKQNQPTRSETVYPKTKGRGRKNQNEGVVAEVVDPGAPTAVEAAAVADLQQKAQPEPEIPNVPEAPPVAPPAAPQEMAAPVVAPVPGEAAPTAPAPMPVQAAPAPVPVEAGPNPAVAPQPAVEVAPAPVAPPEIRPQPDIAPVKIRPQPDIAPAEPVKRTGRVLQVIKDKATKEAEAKAAAAAFKAVNKNVADTFVEKDGEIVAADKTLPKGTKHLTKAEKAEIEHSATKARELFDRHVPENDNIPADASGRARLRERLGAMLDEAKQAKVKIPLKTYESTADHIVYLRDAADLYKKLGQKSFTGQRAIKGITDFMVGERAAKKGDFTVLRERRKVEGDVAKRVDQGDVESKGGTAGAEAEKDAVVTMIPKSARGAPRGLNSEEEAPSAGRVLSGEEKARAIAELNAANARGKVDLAATRTEKKPVEAKPAEVKPAPVAEKKPVISAKPPKATSDAAVTRAGKKTNTEPTEKQKEAGNYAKGTVEWNGLHVALETPKGAIRKGMAKIGGVMREWSVQMQDHYGYVKRTEGADGDQVDVFMGPNPKSDQVWVIDQQDFNGKFDEHKAMLGYDSQQEAMFAYDRAFSDGRGFERIKDIQSMTVDEFKAWVKSDKPKKAKKEIAPDTTDEVYALNPHDGLRLALEATGARDEIHSTTAYDALKSLDLSYMTGVSSKIAPFVQRRLMELVGDTPFHTVSERDMAGLFGRNFEAGEKGPQGSYIPRTELQPAYILKRADAANDPLSNAHVTLHEVTHAATQRALESDPKAKAVVRSMMNEAAEALADNIDGFKAIKYALTNEHEFIAEAFSNPQVQDLLARIDASKELAAKVGLAGQKKFSLWDTFIAAVRKAIGLDAFPGTYSMLEAVLKQGADLMKSERNQRVKSGYDSKIVAPRDFAVENTHQLMEAVKSKIATLGRDPEIQRAESAPWLALRTIDQISQVAGAYFRGNNPVRRIADLLEMRRVKAMALLRKSEPLLDELATLQKKYTKDGDKTWEKFTSLVHDETTANVFADRDLASQTHLGKDVLGTWWSKAQHAGLAARYAELPQDLRDARVKAMKYFADQQNAMSLGIIKNILKVNGISDDALARRIHTGTTLGTDADLLRGDLTLDQIKAAEELAKIEGPYFPLMRRGDFVVQGTYDIATPANATKIEDNVFEFTDRKAVVAYEQQLARDGFKPSIQSRWVDKNTGDTKFPDGTRVTKNDTDAEQRFRVTVQNRHVEFFDSKAEAEKAIADLEKEGVKVKGLEAKRWEPGDRRSDLLSSHMRQLAASLQKRQELNGLDPKQKNEVVQALNEASLRFLGSTRIQSRRLPRRYVLGASNDLTRNTLEYAQSTSGYLAKLEHQPELEVAMKAMRDAVDDDSHKTAQFARSKIANEMEARVASNDVFEESNTWSPITKRIMTLSFLDKLFSPAFNIINSLQPAMVTMPTLAARYGVGKSFDALSRAYSDVSGMTLVKAGFKDSARKVRDARAETTDLFATIKSHLNAKERAMIDYLAERGSIDPEAGMEIASLIKARSGVGGKVDVGLGYLEGIARQMPQAIEMVNRSVTALATYRLEMGRGATHEQAMVKAQEAVNNTQGLYSTTNAAPIFNHPVAKLALQFKKYGQMMYHLLGSNIGKALRNASPEERAEALKTLAGITATHVAMAGALGLPTEPFKYLLMGAQAFGLTTTGWNDVENKVREKAANWFGKTGGEIITKGLPRAAGIDLSTRVGLDSLISFGEPKSNKDTDVKSWLFDTLAGAPAALVSDWVKGANALTSGEFTKAAELLVPMKFAADSIKAYRLMTEGKKGSTGKETMKPYSAREALTRAIGFTPAREAEEGAKRSAFYSAQKRDSTERTALMSAWVSAKPQDKFSAWKKIQSFNKGRPSDQQITMSELTRAADKRRKEGNAIKTTKRDREYLQRAEATYNP